MLLQILQSPSLDVELKQPISSLRKTWWRSKALFTFELAVPYYSSHICNPCATCGRGCELVVREKLVPKENRGKCLTRLSSIGRSTGCTSAVQINYDTCWVESPVPSSPSPRR